MAIYKMRNTCPTCGYVQEKKTGTGISTRKDTNTYWSNNTATCTEWSHRDCGELEKFDNAYDKAQDLIDIRMRKIDPTYTTLR